MIKTDEWHGCYDLNWKNLITDEAFSHPAKFSHALIRRIYQHALKEGMIKPGDTIVDPFGGVALGALYAMKYGLDWVGLELEQKFVDLGNQNIELWNRQFGVHWPNWGRAVLLQGDSRELASVLVGAGMVVSSPPYAKMAPEKNSKSIDLRIQYENYRASGGGQAFEAFVATQEKHSQGYGSTSGQLYALKEGDIHTVISSPPFAGNSGGRGEASRQGIDAGLFDRHSGGMIGGMGEDSGNLGNLKHGDVGAVIGSPPYADGCVRQGKEAHPERLQGSNSGLPNRYGKTEGQLGEMPAGVISSPPYEGSINAHPAAGNYEHRIERMRNAGIDTTKSYNVGGKNSGYQHNMNYGESDGQIGKESGETFWSAARLIVEQCYQILPPNGHAIWVVKDFVRNKEIVEFSDQWRQLCEAVGFRTLHVHRAMLVKNRGVQAAFDSEDDVELIVERKSFFRRLHEKNGLPRIDWETILCMVKK